MLLHIQRIHAVCGAIEGTEESATVAHTQSIIKIKNMNDETNGVMSRVLEILQT